MKNRRSIMTRRMLRDSFLELLEYYQVSQINVKLLCEQADLNRSTFYLHYVSIDEFIEDIAGSFVREKAEELGIIKRNINTVPYITELLTAIEEKPMVYLHLMQDYKITQIYIWQMYQLFYDHLSIPAEIPAEYAITYIVTGSFAMAVRWLKSGCSMPKEELAETIYRLNNSLAYGTD